MSEIIKWWSIFLAVAVTWFVLRWYICPLVRGYIAGAIWQWREIRKKRHEPD